jgi:rhodanese-related sulfurtransferase
MELATLGPGTSFGEEGLIRGGVRGATVEMVTDGTLVRLGKDDFVELIQKPLLNRVGIEDAKQRGNKGAQWIDLRPMKEFAKIAIEGSQNIPGPHLRAMIDRIDPNRACIICSDDSAESALGTFILAEKGYDAAYLDSSVIEYLSQTGEADPEALRTVGASLEDGVIELPEEFASLSTDSFIIKDDEEEEEESSEFINLEPESEISARIDSVSLDGMLSTIHNAVTGLIESENAKLRDRYEAEIAALQQKCEERIQETKERYRAYFSEKEKRLKKKYQEALDKHRQKS